MEPLASSSLLEGLCLRYRGGVEREEVEVFYDELVRLVRKSWRGRDVVVGRKVFGKSLSRLEPSHTTPPLFLQLYFLQRLEMSEIRLKSLKMSE